MGYMDFADDKMDAEADSMDQPQEENAESQPTETPEEEATADVPADVPKETAPEATDFDLDGVKLNGLSKEQVEALTRGVALSKDYTQKTQKLAEERKALEATYTELQSNPMKLREFFTPQHLMQALGMDPRQQPAPKPTATPGTDKFDKFEPEAAELLKGYDNSIQGANREIEALKAQLGQFDNRFKQSDEQAAQVEVEKEVQGALEKYPILNNETHRGYNRQLILMKIAAQPDRSAIEIAEELSKIAATGSPAVPQSKSQTKVVGPGTSVPMGPKTPTSFDEAEQQSHSRFGTTFVR